MEITLYQTKFDHHSEYMICCPHCSLFYTIYETLKEKIIKNDKKCHNCGQYELPIEENVYSFICGSKPIYNFNSEELDKIESIMNIITKGMNLRVYKNTIESSYILK
jgi:uncharacterized Zn finger protein